MVTDKPGWKIRRRIVNTTLIFCAGCVIYTMVWGEDTEKDITIIEGSLSLAGFVIGSYIFGATWDDKGRVG